MNPEFRSPSGLPQSVQSAPGPARSQPVGTGALTLGLGPTSIRLPERGPAHRTHVSLIRESDETNLRPSAVDRLDRRGAADPPGRRGRHRRSGSIAVDAARGPEDAPCPAGPCRRREARSGDSPGTTWALRTTGKRAHRCLSSGSSGRSWPSWWRPWSALGCPPTPIVPLAPAPPSPVRHSGLVPVGWWGGHACRVRGDPAARRRPHELVGGDTKVPKATLYSGLQIPGGGPYAHTAPIPPSVAASRVAVFNAGFLMSNASGGYFTDGETILPLRQGRALSSSTTTAPQQTGSGASTAPRRPPSCP
jgi:hypothetical protein